MAIAVAEKAGTTEMAGKTGMGNGSDGGISSNSIGGKDRDRIDVRNNREGDGSDGGGGVGSSNGMGGKCFVGNVGIVSRCQHHPNDMSS